MNDPSTEYIEMICSLYNDKYDDREEDSKPSGADWQPGQSSLHKSLSAFQRELEEKGVRLSTSKIKKILITGGLWTTERSREIAELYEEYTSSGMNSATAVKSIADELEVSIVTVNTNLPYGSVVYNLEKKSANARRCERYKERHKGTWLWQSIISMEGQTFTTSGRGSRTGVTFSYAVSRTPTTRGGRRYKGESVDGYGNELWITTLPDGERKKKSISRSTAELAYSRAVEADGIVPGPKALGIPGAGSYLYTIFVMIGVIKKAGEV